MTKTAMITGGSEGIGRAFAIRLAKEGYTLTLVARNENKLKAVTSQLGSQHRYLVADLSTSEGQTATVQALSNSHFNLLVNNAGVATLGSFTDVGYEAQLQMFHLNCEALVKLAYTFLKNSKPGDALINTSSALAFMPTPNMALYCATKAFVSSLSDSLWFEQKSRGVYVMGLCPGITETNFQVNAGGKKEDLPKNLSQTPETVVDVAVRELKARAKPTVLTGFKNSMFAGMSRVLSRKKVVSVTAGMMPPSP